MVHSHLSRNCEDAAGGSGGVGVCKWDVNSIHTDSNYYSSYGLRT